MKDIAQELDISIVSVSKALNNKEGISQELRKKILQTAEELGYRPRNSFKQVSGNATIGVLIPNYFLSPTPSFYWSIYEELVNALKEQGYYSILEIIDPYHDLTIPTFFTDKKIDGTIAIGYIPTNYLISIDQYDLPLIMLDFFNENVKGTSILPDNNISSYKMTKYLIEQGHRKIAFVGNILASTNIMDRYLGYYKALLENKIPLNEAWIISDRNEDMRIFQQYELPKIMPTAFVCNTDQTAYWLVECLTSQGYSVPKDVSVTGFYNYAYAKMCKPLLTTVNVDIQNLAYLAVDALLDRLHHRCDTSDIILTYGSIVKRDSVRAI